jgi:hypothetical protein
MPQIFHRSSNTLARVTIFGAVFILGAAGWALAEINRSSWNTNAFVDREQPVQFSHKHHVGDDGIDCRYCHTTVDKAANAGIPPSKTCMNCHSQIWADSPYLEPVRQSYQTGKPIEWTRVHDLPDFVYFNHSIHVNKGVGCSTCHGRVDQMPLTYQFSSLQMEWCLSCHRNPERFVRPKDKVYDITYPAENTTDKEIKEGLRLVAEYKIQRPKTQYEPNVMTSCSTCHR